MICSRLALIMTLTVVGKEESRIVWSTVPIKLGETGNIARRLIISSLLATSISFGYMTTAFHIRSLSLRSCMISPKPPLETSRGRIESALAEH